MKEAILVVDDDPVIRESLQRLLGRRGYAVESAETAEKALMLLGQKPFSLVITDWQMPGMDGLTLLERVKERLPHVPVVMITAYGSTETVIQALRRGVNDFVLKPYRPEELLQIVEREIARHRQAVPAGLSSGIGPGLSREQLEELDILLAQLRLEVGARCVLLVEGNGYVIATKGYIEDLNVSALAALVAGDFAAASGIATLLGEDGSFRLNYHEGERYSAYSAQVTPEVFLVIIFGPDTRLGVVLHFARQALPQLREVITRTVPAVAEATPAGEAAPQEERGRLYTLEEIRRSGLLEADVLAALEAQFGRLWKTEET
ncbi:MAG: response regulator [Chloroflexia bacterium]